MRRAIVHLGLPRTGTTSLQHVFAGQRERLEAAGILYPDLTPSSAAEHHLSHQHLGEALDGRRPAHERAELLATLAAQLGRHEVILLSYEGLCLLPWWRFGPRRLAALFARAGYALEIVATVKPQAELLNSTYTWRAQFLREGRSFAAFLKAEAARPGWDVARRIARWSAAAEGQVTLVPVRDRRSEAPFAARFFADLRLPFVPPPDAVAVRENASPGPVAIAADLALYRSGRSFAAPRAITREIEDLARRAGHDAVRFNGLDEAMRAAVAARWRPANDRLGQRVWGARWDEVVAAEAPAPRNEIVGTNPAVAAVLDRIARSAGSRAHSAGDAGDRWWS